MNDHGRPVAWVIVTGHEPQEPGTGSRVAHLFPWHLA
ncbi:hypothetical protein F4554_001066 [Actinopolymorpha rutila]|uniref:Uncharacterized protein n=1 Tax=Actinopolymorpha rutila TaxID=446787 RepID=A0A852Z9L7_9ACTN|nr:hypothetical protein [Actinopolymorpha rutila]